MRVLIRIALTLLLGIPACFVLVMLFALEALRGTGLPPE
jgi:hypothetical protein